MQNILTAALFSFTLALPIGAGSIQMIRNGINHGSEHAFLTGTGMNVIDIVMMAIYYLGISYIFEFHYVKLALYLIGAFVIGKLAYTSLKGAKSSLEVFKDKQVQTYLNSIKDGIMVALVPSSLIYWVTVYGSFLSTSDSFFQSCAGILLGFFFSNIAYMMVTFVVNKVANNKLVYFINIASGCILSCFVLYFLYQFIMELI